MPCQSFPSSWHTSVDLQSVCVLWAGLSISQRSSSEEVLGRKSSGVVVQCVLGTLGCAWGASPLQESLWSVWDGCELQLQIGRKSRSEIPHNAEFLLCAANWGFTKAQIWGYSPTREEQGWYSDPKQQCWKFLAVLCQDHEGKGGDLCKKTRWWFAEGLYW